MNISVWKSGDASPLFLKCQKSRRCSHDWCARLLLSLSSPLPVNLLSHFGPSRESSAESKLMVTPNGGGAKTKTF